jgi:hypothetical protein
MRDRTVKSVQCVGGEACGRRKVKGGDEGGGTGLKDFICLYETEQILLQLLQVRCGGG